MSCYHPIPAHQAPPTWDATTRRLYGGAVTLNPPVGTANLSLPCGNCLGCAASRAAAWARRLRHEASQWEHSCFVTLTYDQDHLPLDGAVSVPELQKFLKRLRSHVNRHRSSVNSDGSGIVRYFGVGEYGETTDRPHYHVILFNCAFPDRRRVAKDLTESDTLRLLWPFGDHKIGECTPQSMAYVAGYCAKKFQPRGCDADGVVRQRPFALMSRRPPIGKGWLDRYSHDLRAGYLVVDGQKCSIPRTYLRQLDKADGFLADGVRLAAKENVRSTFNDPERLLASEAIHIASLKVQRSL